MAIIINKMEGIGQNVPLVGWSTFLKRRSLCAIFDRKEASGGWSHQDLNLGPSDYESDALTN